jgi:hypothetical protein
VCLVILFHLDHGSKESVSAKICTLAQLGLESEAYHSERKSSEPAPYTLALAVMLPLLSGFSASPPPDRSNRLGGSWTTG